MTWPALNECFSYTIKKRYRTVNAAPTEKDAMSHPPCSVWCSMTHSKIVAVRAMVVGVWFWKQARIYETVLVKMTQESLKSDENCLNRSQFWKWRHLSCTCRQCCGSGSGIGCLFDPWIRDGRKSASGSGMNGMETIRIRDPGWKKVGSGINIPDPPHCLSDFNFE